MNVGNPDEFTILELAEAVLEEVPTSSEIVHCPLPEDDLKVRQPDISVAREILGWEPETTLPQGLRKTVPYFRERVEEEGAEARVL